MRLTPLLFSVRRLEAEIERYFDQVLEAGLLFRRALEHYLRHGADAELEDFVRRITQIEEEADNLRREIESKMTEHTLIPDLREDVLALIEQVDTVTNLYEETVYAFYIQEPELGFLKEGFLEHAELVVKAAEEMVAAARAFFHDLYAVRDHVKKAQFYESEADKVATRQGRALFKSDLDLAVKLHLSQFIERVDNIADTAEDVGDELAILAVKRLV